MESYRVLLLFGGDRVEKLTVLFLQRLLGNFVQGQVDRKETSLETPRFIVSSCQW